MSTENDYDREQRWAQTERLVVKRYVSPALMWIAIGFAGFCGLMFLPWVILIAVSVVVHYPLVVAAAGLLWYGRRVWKRTRG